MLVSPSVNWSVGFRSTQIRSDQIYFSICLPLRPTNRQSRNACCNITTIQPNQSKCCGCFQKQGKQEERKSWRKPASLSLSSLSVRIPGWQCKQLRRFTCLCLVKMMILMMIMMIKCWREHWSPYNSFQLPTHIRKATTLTKFFVIVKAGQIY